MIGRKINMQNKSFAGLACATLLVIVFLSACSAFGGKVGGHTPVIEQLNIDHPTLYPLGNTQIECIAVDSLSHTLTYKWVCNSGKIIGSGSEVIWEAPAAYGDSPIMVTVDDGSGNTVNKFATITVVAREPVKPCASCPK
jgi:hypothetical protein